MFGWFGKKVSVEDYKAKREEVLAIFRKDRHQEPYSIEELETMKNYLKFVESAPTWTGFDLKEERLLRKTIALVLLTQKAR